MAARASNSVKRKLEDFTIKAQQVRDQFVDDYPSLCEEQGLDCDKPGWVLMDNQGLKLIRVDDVKRQRSRHRKKWTTEVTVSSHIEVEDTGSLFVTAPLPRNEFIALVMNTPHLAPVREDILKYMTSNTSSQLYIVNVTEFTARDKSDVRASLMISSCAIFDV